MARRAVVFPGQGSQYVGMGRDLYEQGGIARELFDAADAMLRTPLSTLCFEGPEDELKQTKNAQPAIFLHSIALSKIVSELHAEMTAGHSLGEYSACVFAGALSFEDGLRLVRLRGELMQQAGERQPGTMAAIIGLEAPVVHAICDEASAAGIVQCANYNSPGQIVVSGSVAGVRKAVELAKQHGAKMAKELVVSGAFHSPLMQSALSGLREALHNTEFKDPRFPIYANVSGMPVVKADEIRKNLEDQLTQPVRWSESIQNMIGSGARMFIEIGPGKVLQGLVKRIDGSVQTFGIDRFEDIDKLYRAL